MKKAEKLRLYLCPREAMLLGKEIKSIEVIRVQDGVEILDGVLEKSTDYEITLKFE